MFDTQIIKLLEEGDILEFRGLNTKLFRNQLRLYASSNVRKVGDFCMVFNDMLNISDVIHQVPPEEKQPINFTGLDKTLEVKRYDTDDRQSPNNKKLEVIKHKMKFNESPNGRSSPGFDKSRLSPFPQQRQFNPINKISPLSHSISKPFSLKKKQEISASMKQLLELQRKPSSVSVNKPIQMPNDKRPGSPNKFRRAHSPIKPPQASEPLPKPRVAHSSTNIFRDRNQSILEFKRSALKNVFHKNND